MARLNHGFPERSRSGGPALLMDYGTHATWVSIRFAAILRSARWKALFLCVFMLVSPFVCVWCVYVTSESECCCLLLCVLLLDFDLCVL